MTKLLTALFVLMLFQFTSCKKNTDCIKPTQNPIVKTEETAPLNAKFAMTVHDPSNIFENQVIKFRNLSTGASSCVWEFGNTTKSQALDPEMSYPTHGYYTVKLTVFDGKGNSQSTSSDVSILCLFYNGIHTSGNPQNQ